MNKKVCVKRSQECFSNVILHKNLIKILRVTEENKKKLILFAFLKVEPFIENLVD